MDILIISSGAGALEIKEDERDYICTFSEGYTERFIKHLRNDLDVCTACGDDCTQCRQSTIENFSDSIVGQIRLPQITGHFIEDASDYLPDTLLEHDIAVAINIHSDLLIELPERIVRAGGKALIVPVEDPDWLDEWTKQELIKSCDRAKIEFASAKPFCTLEGNGLPAISRFIQEFKIGKPEIALKIDKGIISEATVICSAPCGATHHVAHMIEGQRSDDKIMETVCKAMSSYPCTASTKVDPELKDSITHKANYVIMDVVRQALR